jgi:hypothetical protein
VEQLYEKTNQSCLVRAQGDQQKADYLMNCGYFEYYYRILQYNKYCDWHAEQLKKTQ